MTDRKQDERGGGAGTAIVTQVKPKTQKPSLYRVLLLNDDFTPMEFVVFVLERFFSKSREDATRIMLHVHQNGVGVCGGYTYEAAENKVAQVVDAARRHQHPLQRTMENACGSPVPSFSQNLEETLHRAIAYANQRSHEYATLEHLLLSLADDREAAQVMKACSVDLGALKKSVTNYLDTELGQLVVEDDDDAKP